jgi:acylphosphatase
MVVGKRALYSGQVQGVGFRYTTQRVAQGLAVAGFVRNLTNGQVELVAEGTAEQVDELLRRVSAAMAGHVTQVELTDVPPEGRIGFYVRH